MFLKYALSQLHRWFTPLSHDMLLGSTKNVENLEDLKHNG